MFTLYCQLFVTTVQKLCCARQKFYCVVCRKFTLHTAGNILVHTAESPIYTLLKVFCTVQTIYSVDCRKSTCTVYTTESLLGTLQKVNFAQFRKFALHTTESLLCTLLQKVCFSKYRKSALRFENEVYSSLCRKSNLHTAGSQLITVQKVCLHCTGLVSVVLLVLTVLQYGRG